MAPEENNMTDLQKEIFDLINKNAAAELKVLLAANRIKVDFVDEKGVSPLGHASYKGNKEIVQMLLDQGADVNVCHHENAYTALHFAALGGNAEICYLLMSLGAKVTINDVNKTPAQIAAFIGNHKCAATMNNFIPKADIDYYIKPQGLRTEAMLPPHLADSFHKFTMQINVHPIRVLINLQKCPGLLENSEKIQKVLEAMRSREMSRGTDMNEIMAFKFHYLSCIIGHVVKCQKRQEAMRAERNEPASTEEKKSNDPVELLVRKVLKCNKNGGQPEYQEAMVREAVREFPYIKSTIFRQMVATLASSDPPSAVSVVSAAINGQRGFVDNCQVCVTCGEDNAPKKCSKCKAVQYCDRECQRFHWFLHKKACARLGQQSAASPSAKITDVEQTQSRIHKALATEMKCAAVN